MLRFLQLPDLPLIATGCNYGLHEDSIVGRRPWLRNWVPGDVCVGRSFRA